MTAPAVAEADATVPLAGATDRLVTPFGVTTISRRACEKVAARAAGEVDGVETVRSGVSRLAPWASGETAGASADVDGGWAFVDLTIRVRYPLPVGQTAGRVREHVTSRLRELAGMAVREVTVTVADLPADDGPARRRVV